MEAEEVNDDDDQEDFDAKELEHLEADSFDEDFGSATEGEEEGGEGSGKEDSEDSQGNKLTVRRQGKASVHRKAELNGKDKVNFRRTKKQKLVRFLLQSLRPRKEPSISKEK